MNRPTLTLCAILWGILCHWPASAWAKPDAAESSIGAHVQGLLQWADQHNPELAALRHEAEAAQSRIQPAGALPDPVLRVELRDFAGSAAPERFNPLPGKGNGTKYTLMQRFPLWGKRDLKQEMASAELAQASGRQQSGRVEIHTRIKTAYAQYYQAVNVRKLYEEILHVLNELEKTAQTRYASGLVPQQDVIRAQVEKTLLHTEIITLETEQHHATIRLNTMLGRPKHAGLVEPQSLRHIATDKLNASSLQQKALGSNPALVTQAAQISAAHANQRLVEKNRYPDITLGIAPIQRSSRINSWEAMIEMNIPIRSDTLRSQEHEAQALLTAAQDRQQAIENQISGNLQEALTALQAAQKQERLLADTLLPQAELTYQSALSGYENGKVDFATLLDAQRAIKRARQDKLKARVEQEIRLADIESIVGEEL